MARATIPKTRSASGRQPAKRAGAKSKAMTAGQALKPVKTGTPGRRPGVQQAAAASASSKDELRARIEKLERANSTLRAKNKELRFAYVEAAEKVDQLTVRLETAERKAGRQAQQETAADVGTGRARSTATRRRGPARTAAAQPEEGPAEEEHPSEFMARISEREVV